MVGPAGLGLVALRSNHEVDAVTDLVADLDCAHEAGVESENVMFDDFG